MASTSTSTTKSLLTERIMQAPDHDEEPHYSERTGGPMHERTNLCDKDEQDRGAVHRARRPQSRLHSLRLLPVLFDVLLGTAALLFLVFACLVYTNRGQPMVEPMPQFLLKASTYGPTVFPIVFAAIIGRFLRAVAALKMEHGSSVLTMEYLLSSRTVVSAVMTPFELRTWHFLIPLLLMLWAFSPLGSQASLRIIWTEASYTHTTTQVHYVDFMSRYGLRSSAGSGQPVITSAVYSLFASALLSNRATQQSAQDQYGHVKIPIYQDVKSGPVNTNGTLWHDVPLEDDQVVWSSLQGIPVSGIPQSGHSTFVINTAYIGTDCDVTGKKPAGIGHEQLANCKSEALNASMKGFSNCWSGANLAIEGYNISGLPNYGAHAWVNVSSYNYWSNDNKTMTNALCWLTINYVEVNITCEGSRCRSRHIRPSQDLLNSTLTMQAQGLDIGYMTPLNDWKESGYDTLTFFSHLVDASIDADLACTSMRCAVSQLEGYILDPYRFYWGEGTGRPNLWTISDELFSTRFTQLINTFYIEGIANQAIVGNSDELVTPLQSQPTTEMPQSPRFYSTQNTTADVTTSQEVVRCSIPWFLTLLIASGLLLLASIATAFINIARKAPDILTSFTSLLRYNQYASLPHQPSLDDSVDIARRLGKTRVLFGNVKPDEDIGYAALSVTGHGAVVTKLERRKIYD
ncbi:hypothetical protein Slin15195_G112570 [Septoria linicola]|uniref:Uncharacterized protein n=1 Tax=Septoria linicola TaxID=215465 RepID=A0A9Q9B2V6_9PEZI|nr:hypothetical protein Slin15195_G112570 [Septoria linicola]